MNDSLPNFPEWYVKFHPDYDRIITDCLVWSCHTERTHKITTYVFGLEYSSKAGGKRWMETC